MSALKDVPTAALFPELTPLPGKQTGDGLRELVGLMQRLLAPSGCPWDREQTLSTLVPYLVEETYEVVDALAQGDVPGHREELGDLLLQVVFQSELRFSEGHFGIDDVCKGIVTKLVRRHPHVFGDVKVGGTDDVLKNWAAVKAQEKAEKGKKGALDGIPRSAPALLRASRTGEKAAAVGFDWPDVTGVREKVSEELEELDRAVTQGDQHAMQSELGDLLFSVVNLARKLGIDPENALRGTVDRFAHRFRHMEESVASRGETLGGLDFQAQDRLWVAAKAALQTEEGKSQGSEPSPSIAQTSGE